MWVSDIWISDMWISDVWISDMWISDMWISWPRTRVFLGWVMVDMKRMCEPSLAFRKCPYNSWCSLYDLTIGIWCTGSRRTRCFQTENNSYVNVRFLETPFFWTLKEKEKYRVALCRTMPRPAQQTPQRPSWKRYLRKVNIHAGCLRSPDFNPYDYN
jgi:hypothetical protein